MKRFITGAVAIALICSFGAMNALAAEGSSQNSTHPSFGQRRERGERKDISEADNAQMEVAMAQRKEKLDAFVNTLTAEQKALYEAMTPARPADGQRFERPANGQRPEKPSDGQRPERSANIQRPERPDDSAMKEAREAFVASLTDEQKTAYEEFMGSMQRGFRAKED